MGISGGDIAMIRSSGVGLTFLSAVLIAGLIIALAPKAMAASAASSPGTAKVWAEECGACHDAYPRSLLPGYSWKRIMEHLDDHFGSDASLDPKTRRRITDYLIAGRPAEIPIRITDQPWFARIHGGRVAIFAVDKDIRLTHCKGCHQF